MKSVISALIILLFLNSINCKAQYIALTDPAFINYMQWNHSSCMNGNMMDTNCVDNITSLTINYNNTAYANLNLQGLEHFNNLTQLFLDGDMSGTAVNNIHIPNIANLNNLDIVRIGNSFNIQIDSLPNSLNELHILKYSTISSFSYPNSLETLSYDHCPINTIGGLPSTLENLNVESCPNLVSIVSFPSTIKSVKVASCVNFTSLPSFLYSLEQLNLSGDTSFSNLPALPSSLIGLDISFTDVNSIPYVNNLLSLNCAHTSVSSIPIFLNLVSLNFSYCNNVSSFPQLSNTITNLFYEGNDLILTNCPSNVKTIGCGFTPLQNINSTTFAKSLEHLHCGGDSLKSITGLPDSLKYLYVYYSDNIITSPVFSNNLIHINLDCPNLYCLNKLPNSLEILNMVTTPIFCIPNIPTNPNFSSMYPLCLPYDSINNPYSCQTYASLLCNAYKDSNSNCLKDANEPNVLNIPYKVYNYNNNLIAQGTSDYNGINGFSTDTGIHFISIDTLINNSISTSCHGYTQSFNSQNNVTSNVLFDIECNTGFDVGAHSLNASGWVFPGQIHTMKLLAGDMANWNGLSCIAGVGGQVKFSVNGPVSYVDIPSGALIPSSIVGNVFTYNIANFESVDFFNSFHVNFMTDTSAQAFDNICVSVLVIPSINDNDSMNNELTHCYPVINSLDPNDKQVYPTTLKSNDDYLTYTIRFQNTGTAPAFNIRIKDTLDSDLDLNTFKIINYSHKNATTLYGNIAEFRFENIMLLDSFTNEPASHGFIQYKIKPKSTFAFPGTIDNTAHIYFDYNAAVTTNTTTTGFEIPTAANIIQKKELKIYPNPSRSFITIEGMQVNEQGNELHMYNSIGQLVLQRKLIASTRKIELDIHALSNGVYLLKVGTYTSKIIKE